MLENPSENIDGKQKVEDDENLKIESDVDDDTFKKVYRKVFGKTHPDKKGGDDDKFTKGQTGSIEQKISVIY